MPRSSSRPPLDPRAAALVRAQLSRRGVLRGAGAAGAAAFLAACGAKSPEGTPAPAPSASGSPSPTISPGTDVSDSEKIVNWANWPEYLDVDEKSGKYPTLQAFMKQSGIKATYAEDIDGNDSYYGKVQGQLKKGQDIGKDIIVFTDWMAGRCIRNGYVQKLDRANIPNADNILDSLADVDFDKGRQYSLTWQSGFAGIAYRKDKVGRELRTIEDLWDPKLKGKVVLLDEMRDTVGLIMLSQGKDISGPFSEDDFMAAVQEIEKRIASGHVRQVQGNSYIEVLKSGNAVASLGWSGDVITARTETEDENYTFQIPESGGTLWSDNLLVPIGARHKKNAETLFNYYYDPKVAATVAAYVNYICPVEGAKEEMAKIDASLVNSPFIFPDDATLKNAKGFRTLSPDEERRFNDAFQKVIGA